MDFAAVFFRAKDGKRLAFLQTLDFFGSQGGIPALLRDRVVNPERFRDSAG